MTLTASHYEIAVEPSEDEFRVETSSDLQDLEMAAEHRGLAYASWVVFTDGSRRRIS
jgi:hypothetical protein